MRNRESEAERQRNTEIKRQTQRQNKREGGKDNYIYKDKKRKETGGCERKSKRLSRR